MDYRQYDSSKPCGASHLMPEQKAFAAIRSALEYGLTQSEDGALPAMEISLESRLAEDLGCDTLDVAECILAAEEALGDIHIPDEEADKVKTVGDIVNAATKALKSGSRYA